MMRELSPERMKTFYVANTGSPELMTKVNYSLCFLIFPELSVFTNFRMKFQRSGIKDLFPEANIADYLFEPCGYSVNGVMKSVSGFL